jgi:uncharacterized protein
MSGMRPLRLLLLAAAASVAFASDALIPLDARQVKVRGEIGRRIDVTIANNLLVLDTDHDFVQPFLTKNQKDGYIGLGKLIMAATRLAAYSGNERVKALKDRLVARVIESQAADGYPGMLAEGARIHELWDVHEVGYLIAGLTDDYRLFGSPRSLEAARKAADYVIAHWNQVPSGWAGRTGVATHVAVTGLERTMLALHAATRDKRYLDFVTGERALESWDMPVVVGRREGIEGHIYAYMTRSLAQLELYRIDPRASLTLNADRALDFMRRQDGMAITGGAGQWEIWTGDQDGRGALGESCATAYQLRVYDSLLRLRGDAGYGDMMERTIYNALFAAQSPDGRRIRYYSPLEGPRVYHPGDTYCCPCNFRRIISELPEFVYYSSAAGITVNLYADSEASFKAGGAQVAIRQETDYPSGGSITIHVQPSGPARFALRLRIPAWARGARVWTAPGAPAATPEPGTFHEINRQWREGDTVRVEFPMPVRLVRGRQQQAGRVAVMRGPMVYCLNPAQAKALESVDAADLIRFTLDARSLEPVPDDSVRPDGRALRAGFWKPGYTTANRPEMELKLTEFADPGGRATYFRVRDLGGAVEDELVRR